MADQLKVYTVTGFTGHWPVGPAAVVVARDLAHAEALMDAELVRRGLPTDKYAMISLRLEPGAHVLCDGDY